MNFREKTKEIIADICGIEPASLSESMDFVGDLGVDSVKAMELIVAVEDHFDIELGEKIENGLNSVGELLQGVDELLQGANS